jgi:hypothetical protein
MTEPTYSLFRLAIKSSKHLKFSKKQSSSLNNRRMNMKSFEPNLAYNSLKHPSLGRMRFKEEFKLLYNERLSIVTMTIHIT